MREAFNPKLLEMLTAKAAGKPITPETVKKMVQEDLPEPQKTVMMQVLAEHRGEVLHRDQILEKAWGYVKGLNTRTVDNHVVKVRQQIEDDPNNPRYLVTAHGIGYKLAV